MAALLQQVKGGGQGQAISKSEVAAAADNILGPLMDLLDGEINKDFELIQWIEIKFYISRFTFNVCWELW